MKIALIGYGKMGRAIETIALERGHQIVARFDSKSGVDKKVLATADVAIEYTRPELAIEHIKQCFDKKVPVVVGTTGWYEHFDDIKKSSAKHDGGLFYATNFSLGVNLFYEINKKLAKLLNSHPEYKVGVKEIHHTQKLDKPSGTGLTLVEQIIDGLDVKENWVLGETKDEKLVPIVSERTGLVPGTHIITYTSPVDKIEIKHEAFNRQGFALGSVLAAEFMVGKSGIYTMSDLLKSF